MTKSHQVESQSDPLQRFREYLARQGLKSTRQREVIVRNFFRLNKHITIDELLIETRRESAQIGYATVYRTLKLLTESGLAKSRQFGHGQTLFEPHEDGSHHDHLICTECGLIVEFENDEIEQLQLQVAESHGYVVTHHKMELYGLCSDCRG